MTEKTWVYTCLSELMEAARAHQPPHLRDQTLEACRKALIEYNAERAVVEAAAVCVDGFREKESAQGLFDRIALLAFKVEALQKERE